MLTIVYRLIIAIIAVVTIICTLREKDVRKQINNILVLVPFVLRALMIK